MPSVNRNHAQVEEIPWDNTVDVVVVGSGAAGLTAAVSAALTGASVVVLEAERAVGGTTAKSSGGMWVPNNPLMQDLGLPDPRTAALRYMARVSHPALFSDTAPNFGLSPLEYSLLESCYDHGSEALEALLDSEALFLDRKRGNPYPDYHSDLPQNEAPLGRTVAPTLPPGESLPPEAITNPSLVGGSVLIETMRRTAEKLGVRILLGHRVVHVHCNETGDAVGVEAHAGGGRGTVLVGARRGIVFGSGGFLHEDRLCREFLRGRVFGGCAAAGSRGDFVRIGTEVGAQLGNMTEAWWDQVVLDIALRSRETAGDVWFPFGDSMIQVNKYGRRVMDEKQTYNDRGPVHFAWDAGRREFPNLLLFQIYDDVVANSPMPGPFRGLVPMPGENVDYVLSADTFEELAELIDTRLSKIEDITGDVRLDPVFASELKNSVDRFSAFAEQGVDADFNRGEKPIQIAWQGPPRPGLKNPCLAPFAATGRYHCIILAAGALDTKGGPRVNAEAQVLDLEGVPIPGLYGAGNCVAAPAAAGYWGGGGTIGPAVTFGYLAGKNAAAETPRM